MIEYRLNGKIVKGPIIKENPLTIWTKTPESWYGKHIKRHKIKHGIVKTKSLKT